MITIEVDRKELDRVLGKLTKTYQRMKLMRLMSTRSAELIRERVYKKKRTPEGQAWDKRVKDVPWPLLVKEEKMVKTIKPKVKNFGKANVTVGTRYGQRQNAMREFMGVGEDDLRELDKVLNSWALEVLS